LNWPDRLQKAVSARGALLEGREMPRLKQQFEIYLAAYQNIFKLFLKKGLIQEDPYGYDEKISEVTLPSSSEFQESEKQNQMSQRLSFLQTQIEFLNTYYQFSLDFLDLKRIKKMSDLIDFIYWDHLSGAGANVVSRSLNEYVGRIKLGTDSLSSQIVHETVALLGKTTSQIKSILKAMADYQRECHKLEVRKIVLPRLEAGLADQESRLKAIRELFPTLMEGSPFYPELIQEILAEDFSPDGPVLREDVLRKLQTASGKPAQAEKASRREMLLQAVRFMASSGFQLQDVVNKMEDNHLVLQSSRTGFLERLRRFFKRLFGGGAVHEMYEIEYMDSASSMTRAETVHYLVFIEELSRKAKLFTALTDRNSSTTRKLMAASDPEILKFLDRNLESLSALHRRITGFNDHFRKEIAKLKQGKYRGLKVELSSIKNCLIKARHARYEYSAGLEEQEEMKKLGIKPEES